MINLLDKHTSFFTSTLPKSPFLTLSSRRQYCGHAAKQLWVSATPPLPFWTYCMRWAHSITTSCTCVNNTSCNQSKVVPQLEITAPRIEWEHLSCWQYSMVHTNINANWWARLYTLMSGKIISCKITALRWKTQRMSIKCIQLTVYSMLTNTEEHITKTI